MRKVLHRGVGVSDLEILFAHVLRGVDERLEAVREGCVSPVAHDEHQPCIRVDIVQELDGAVIQQAVGALIPHDALARLAGVALQDEIAHRPQHHRREVPAAVPAVAAPRQPGAHLGIAHQCFQQRRAAEEMRLVVAMYIRVHAQQAGEQRGAGAGVTEDEELRHGEEQPGFSRLFWGDGRDKLALRLFGSGAFDQDRRGKLDALGQIHRHSVALA